MHTSLASGPQPPARGKRAAKHEDDDDQGVGEDIIATNEFNALLEHKDEDDQEVGQVCNSEGRSTYPAKPIS